jgi:hypothetical protein
MRLDMGVRANTMIDSRVASMPEGKAAQEQYDLLMKYAL